MKALPITLRVISAVIQVFNKEYQLYCSFQTIFKRKLARVYFISDKNYGKFKRSLLFIAMLLPLFLMGPAKLSLDAIFKYFLTQRDYCDTKSFDKN